MSGIPIARKYPASVVVYSSSGGIFVARARVALDPHRILIHAVRLERQAATSARPSVTPGNCAARSVSRA